MSERVNAESVDRAKLQELGWADPPSVPSRPGATLSWEVATADEVTFIVASDPGNSDAWIAAASLQDVHEG